MKTFLTSILILLFTSFWSINIKPDNFLEIQPVNRLERWLSYYNLKLTDFTDTVSVEKLKRDNIQYEYPPVVSDLYRQFFIASPDSKFYIDLDSYSLVLGKDSVGKLVSFGSEVDTEVYLYNISEKIISRILFCGTEEKIEEASWLNNDLVYILGFSRKIDSYFPTIYSYKISDNSLVIIQYHNPIDRSKLDYPIKTRLKTIDFK
jgi:hypothetical protein